MKNPAYTFSMKSLSLAVAAGLFAQSGVALAQSEEEAIEEVVATGTRLKGTATAVMEERKNQAFVADIMGAEQISRTGDGDAASALRRVTGLTLVDGKFIYVRGLGERYSSTQLNGASVPSPDPTRNVIPLDLFPSGIIESLSVQKAFSPSMPASFGGGNVNVRLKSIPSQYIFNMSGSLGTNTNNFDDAYFYATKKFAYVYEETPLDEALLKMEKLKIWDLPVINIKKELKGLLHLHPALKLVLGISSKKI